MKTNIPKNPALYVEFIIIPIHLLCLAAPRSAAVRLTGDPTPRILNK